MKNIQKIERVEVAGYEFEVRIVEGKLLIKDAFNRFIKVGKYFNKNKLYLLEYFKNVEDLYNQILVKVSPLHMLEDKLNKTLNIKITDDLKYLYTREITGGVFSCMIGKGHYYTHLQEILKNKDSLKAIIIEDLEGNLISRALLWIDDNNKKIFLDRIYARYKETTEQIFINFIDEIYPRNYQIKSRTDGYIKSEFELETNRNDTTGFIYLPYMDSFRYIKYKDGGLFLSSYFEDNIPAVVLSATDGAVYTAENENSLYLEYRDIYSVTNFLDKVEEEECYNMIEIWGREPMDEDELNRDYYYLTVVTGDGDYFIVLEDDISEFLASSDASYPLTIEERR